jgi:microcin C transport system substrate-binding protein
MNAGAYFEALHFHLDGPMTTTRRTFLRSAATAIAAPAVAHLAVGPGRLAAQTAAELDWRHGIAMFGELKYPPQFARFDYVNPNAPKGGTARLAATGTFDNFNVVIAGVKGQLAAVIDSSYFYETLMTPSLDEESSAYGLLAEAVSFPADRSSVTYRLRAEARWHDGRPITPGDVIFSFDVLRANSPQASAYYRRVTKAEQTGEREVTFTFDAPGIRELPQIVGEFSILPKHWWGATDTAGRRRNVTETTLEPPLASGPYRIKAFEAGRNITFERVADYWGKDLNVRIGHDNFGEMRIDYFRDTDVEFEAFKGDQFDWYDEKAAKNWATGYGFPAVKDKRVLREEFPIRNVGMMQGFAFNLRRRQFRDPRVRRAFNFAMDFESINSQIFFGQYTRIASYFDGTELAATGLPQGRELEILEAARSKLPAEVPPEVFTTPYTNPVGGGAQAMRPNLREAARLLEAAGYVIRNLKLVDAKSGQPLTAEFLLEDPTYERFVLFYVEALKRLGVQVTVRTVDDVQYENRLRRRDYDIVVASWDETLSPGNEQREFWGSQAADTVGSRNLVGIKNPAIDLLIDRVVMAQDRDDLTAAARALDRVLLWNHYVVPQWNYPKARTARWDRFGRPEQLPEFGQAAFPAIWWWDAARAAKIPSPRR